ncbi:hypothetical protein M0804_007861 [Polistes exclamans]|nr:hypothetical protein M0804_007861 [Polistes exclamans]
MTVVKSTFIILGICGCWRPMSWSLSFYKRHIYNFYTIFIAFLVTTLSLTQIVGIILNANENDDISDDVYVFLAHFVSCFKMLTLVINRNNIVNLIVTLENEPHRIMDNVEANLQMKFDKLSRFNTHGYAFLISLSVTNFLFSSLVSDFKERQLTFRVWLPFDAYMTPLVYYLTYVHQMLSLTLGAIIHVALDTLICNLLITICCQIKLLENRLSKITNERKNILKLCIRHHESIYKYAASVNKTFKFAIFMQFLASTLTVCFTLFQLTKVSTFSLEFVKITVFISGIFIQVYLYCSYGHLVTLKSQEIVYQIFDTNLVGLNNDMKKSLLIMMNRTTRPIVFIVMNLFPLNLDSFVNILKTAYTAYNFLTQTQEE